MVFHSIGNYAKSCVLHFPPSIPHLTCGKAGRRGICTTLGKEVPMLFGLATFIHTNPPSPNMTSKNYNASVTFLMPS